MSVDVEFCDVRKIYPSPQGNVEAVGGVSMTVAAGSFVSIVGPSGCGKSTLLQIAAGLAEATKGEVRMNGRVVKGPPPEAIYLFQQYTKSVFPWKTVYDNVAFGLRYRQQSRGHATERTIRDDCERMIELVGLKKFRDYYPFQLSGGMQQRVAIARALVCRPDVLLMDEPFSAVDALTRAELQDGLLRLWSEFRPTIIFITHDIDEAIYLSERIIVLSRAPTKISQCVDIDVPYPRDQIETKELPSVLHYRRTVLADITSRSGDTGVLQ